MTERQRRTQMQRVHFWGGFWGLLVTIGIGVQLGLTLAPWRHSGARAVSPSLSWQSVVYGVVGAVFATGGVIALPVWIGARKRLDQLSDERRFRLCTLCWSGLIYVVVMWAVSTIVIAIVG